MDSPLIAARNCIECWSDNVTDEFKAFELQGWQGAVEQYDVSFSRLTQQTMPRMLDVLGVSEGTRFLDIACGPGYLTAQASRRGARAIGVDFSAAMIEKAKSHYADVTFQVGDAEKLDGFADGTFDAVGMNFGILHLSNPEKALREMYRVLAPVGRVAFTAWCKPEEAVGFSLVLKAIEERGDPNLPLPRGPAFFQYSDPTECERLLGKSGFTQRVEKLELMWKLASTDELFTAFLHGTARTGGLLRSQKPADLIRIREAVRESVKAFSDKGEVILPMPALLAWGMK